MRLRETLVAIVFGVLVYGWALPNVTRLSDSQYRLDIAVLAPRLCTIVSAVKVSCVNIDEGVAKP